MANFIPPLIKRTSSAAVSRAIWRRPGIKLRGSSIGTHSRQTCAKEKEKGGGEVFSNAAPVGRGLASQHQTGGLLFPTSPRQSPRCLTISNTLFVFLFFMHQWEETSQIEKKKKMFCKCFWKEVTGLQWRVECVQWAPLAPLSCLWSLPWRGEILLSSHSPPKFTHYRPARINLTILVVSQSIIYVWAEGVPA